MNTNSELTPQEIEICNSWLVADVASGTLTEDQANAIGREANSNFPDGVPAAPAPVNPVDIPAAPSIAAYRFPLHVEPGQSETSARAADRALRSYLLAAGFDGPRGSQLAKAINESAQTTRQYSDMQHDLHGNREFRNLGWDEATWEQRAPAMKKFIDDVERRKPGFKSLLEKTGSLNSATVSLLLFTQSEIERERREWKPGL